MSVVLQDEGERALRVDCWTWGAFHAVVSVAHVFPEAAWASLRFNGGGSLSRAQAHRLAAFVETVLLPCLRAGEHLMLDGTVVRGEPPREFQTDEVQAWRDYSLSHEALGRLLAFLRAAEGPVRVC